MEEAFAKMMQAQEKRSRRLTHIACLSSHLHALLFLCRVLSLFDPLLSVVTSFVCSRIAFVHHFFLLLFTHCFCLSLFSCLPNAFGRHFLCLFTHCFCSSLFLLLFTRCFCSSLLARACVHVFFCGVLARIVVFVPCPRTHSLLCSSLIFVTALQTQGSHGRHDEIGAGKRRATARCRCPCPGRCRTGPMPSQAAALNETPASRCRCRC